MKWKRERPGLYRAGPYAVAHHDHSGGFWTAEGPGLPEVELGAQSLKSDAQYACERAARARLIDISDGYTVTPVVGDVVRVLDNWYGGRYNSITQITTAHTGATLYCIVAPHRRHGGVRLLRHEFVVVAAP